jgi:cleavage and polyadenylation specificity factor subunit 1
VPEPDRPETNRRLRLIVKDEVKGAVSAISEVGTQGFLIMAQGQKCMVRGLKEDGTLLPVAFMDMQCYVTVLKSMPNTGMLLMGDAFKGVWFTGYTVCQVPISNARHFADDAPGRALQNDAFRSE